MNPYTAPEAPIDAQGGGPPSALDARIVRLAVALGAAFGFGVGCVQTIQFGFGLRRFGGLEYVPRVVVLSLLRADGPSVALSATCYAAVVVFHRARAGAPVVERLRTGFFVAGAVLLLFPLATLLGTMGSALALGAIYAQGVSAFVASVRETLLWSDVGAGAAMTVAYAAAAGVVIPLLGPKIGRARRHVVLKLAAVFVALSLLHLVEGVVRASLA